MSKIGRKPIELGSVSVQVNNNVVTFKGPKASGSHTLPENLSAKVVDKTLEISLKSKEATRADKRIWGLHRALLANDINGADVGFSKQLQINGLGFKASVSGTKAVFVLGFTHKIEFTLPKDVTMEVDKTGQLLTFKSANRMMLGEVCDKVRSMRPPEPYKGTGVKYFTEVIKRKAGKAKVAATAA